MGALQSLGKATSDGLEKHGFPTVVAILLLIAIGFIGYKIGEIGVEFMRTFMAERKEESEELKTIIKENTAASVLAQEAQENLLEHQANMTEVLEDFTKVYAQQQEVTNHQAVALEKQAAALAEHTQEIKRWRWLIPKDNNGDAASPPVPLVGSSP